MGTGKIINLRVAKRASPPTTRVNSPTQEWKLGRMCRLRRELWTLTETCSQSFTKAKLQSRISPRKIRKTKIFTIFKTGSKRAQV